MRTSLDCLACFRDQVRKTVSLVSDDPATLRRVCKQTDELLSRLDLSVSPPEHAVSVYGLIAEITGIPDPYASLRRQSNSMALSLRDTVLRQIEASEHPLKTAVHYAVAANIIDYGARYDFDAMDILTGCLQQDFAIDDSGLLADELNGSAGSKVMYLADNSGEIVFDGLLVEQLQKSGCDVTLAVRGTPILNDVTLEDCTVCGIDKICRVLANGTGCPGTPLSSCSDTFQAAFKEADLIISKGQGNFETLSDVQAPIYFLLTVKCPVVGRHIQKLRGRAGGHPIGNGEMIVMKRTS